MALTNFAAMTDEQKTVWSRQMWRAARNYAFSSRFMGSDSNSMIQRITELTKSEKGARAVLTLVADLEGDGIAGDRTLEGNEEAGKSYDQVIQLDQLRHATRHEGRMADQRSIINFRETARDNLAYWLSDRMDQLAFLTLSGISYTKHTNGRDRVGSDFINLEFAGDVSAPTSDRLLTWNGTDNDFTHSANTDLTSADTPTWRMLVEAKAYAKDNYIRPIRGEQGMEVFNVFMTPQGIAKLKLDEDFMKAWQHAMPRNSNNPLFKGTPVIYVDGLAIYEYRHVYNTKGAATGDKWGDGTIDGQRVLLCGTQAMGFADIGMPEWVEKSFDYDNQQAISTGKIMGLKKPVFQSQVSESPQDFGVICIDTAL